MESSSSSEIDNIIQEGEIIFKKKPTGLPEVSRLIKSAISKRPNEEQVSWEKSTAQKGKWIHYEHSEISQCLMDRALKQSTRQFHKIFFNISKCLACTSEKTLQLKITKNKWISLTWKMYVQIYIPILYVTRMTQNKIDSINLILQHGGAVDKNYWVVFLTSGLPYYLLS